MIHSDGVDFRLLDPLWFAVVLFIALPAVHVAALDVAASRIRVWRSVPAPVAIGAFSWVLRLGLAVLFVVAVASLVGDVHALTDAPG